MVGGFSKSYSSLLAFLALPTALKNHLKVAAAPYLYSGPSPVASLATVLAGFDVNDAEGDALRDRLAAMTASVLDRRWSELGILTLNTSGLPIIEVPLSRPEDIDAVGRFLFDRGVYVTLAAYPLVPKSQVGFRVQLTAANSDEEVDHRSRSSARSATGSSFARPPTPRRRGRRRTTSGGHDRSTPPKVSIGPARYR